jgi:hypothetical protein
MVFQWPSFLIKINVKFGHLIQIEYNIGELWSDFQMINKYSKENNMKSCAKSKWKL